MAQETFVAAWKTLSSLRDPASLRPWLCRIARNRIGDVFRSEKNEPSRAAEALDQTEEAPAPEPLPSDDAISREEEGILWRAIEGIPEIYREPLILFYREHQSIRSVAQHLDLSEDAVKQRLARGRKLLQDQVLAFVEGALAKTSPGKLFTLSVLAALPLAATSAKAAAVGSTIAAASAGAKTATVVGSVGGFFPPLLGVLGLYHIFKSEIQDANSPRERQLMIRVVWIRIAFIIPYLALLCLCMKHLDSQRHPLAFEIAMAALVFGIAIFAVVLSSYFDRRRLQIEMDRALETGRSDGSSADPIRKGSPRKAYVGAVAVMAFPLSWLLVSVMGAFRTGLWVTALLALLVGGMCFYLAVQSWKRRPQYFINFGFGKAVQFVGLCGLITLLQYNFGHYLNGILAINNNTGAVVTGHGAVAAFNAAVVLVYAAFIGILLRKRKNELRLGSL